MREILFRGKAKNNGQWVYGTYCPSGWNICGERKENPHIIIISDDKIIDGLWCEVISETVGQYTGLTDKNGKKIFEGDIVHAVYSDGYIGVPDTDYGNLIVGFDDTYYGGARYSMKTIGDTGYRIFSAGLRNGVAVIGNTHDNPELLKVGDDT